MMSRLSEVWQTLSKKSIREIIDYMFAQAYRGMFFILNPRCIATSISDDQAYPQVCIKASNDYRRFNNFRRNPIYNMILEHVHNEHGHQYFQAICKDQEILGEMDKFKLNDAYGNPRMYAYNGIGMISPTTLRYIKVLSDLKSHFQTLDNLHICEIGVGYGGQCRVINAYYRPASYCLVDLQPALSLTQRYLDNFILNSVLTYRTANELEPREYDLVISNYAFSELRRDLQTAYLKKVILKSKRGYITYNEIVPDAFKSYQLTELTKLIPGSRVLKEEPLTHSGNALIVWGESAP
jgi:putative sugar O-methyltransferase